MTQTIAAAASLALAMKLNTIYKDIFEEDDKYLTFPNTSLGFSYDYLEFMKDPFKTTLSAQERLNFMADFSRQMNFIPEDREIFVPDTSRFIWDINREILISSIFAESVLTQDEEKQLAEAIDFLTDDTEDEEGNKIKVYSPELYKYYEYMSIAKEAERTYLEEKLSIDLAEGPYEQELKEEWNSYREKELREKWNQAEEDWIKFGFKQQVEEYIAVKNNLEIRRSLNVYRQACLNEMAISEISDLNGRGIGFYTTFFSPINAFDKQLPWTSITLTKSEIASLISEAPSELKNIFGDDQGEVDIEAISLEYNNVIILRPWFKPEFFESRYWKLPDDKVVSDGQIPRGGILPAFFTSIIVARNIVISRRKELEHQPIIFPSTSKVSVQELRLSEAQVQKIEDYTQPPEVTVVKLLASAMSTLPKSSSFTRIKFAPTEIESLVIGDVEKVLPKFINIKQSYTNAKYKGTTFEALRESQIHRILEDDPRIQLENNELVTEKIDFDGVIVLALVCNRLPKSPNPDTSLQW
ncbi:MAG TPA: hypothetical protein VHO68_08865 [Bacteroidales bacterium]|nr:hypothetical protein [Bacteroidales bacterium]